MLKTIPRENRTEKKVPSELDGRSTSPSFGDLGALRAIPLDLTLAVVDEVCEREGSEAGVVYEAA
jgi:hypothetical protein